MKFKEILDRNRGLATEIVKELGVTHSSITNWKECKKKPNFTTKKNIYEILLDYKLINPDDTSIDELF